MRVRRRPEGYPGARGAAGRRLASRRGRKLVLYRGRDRPPRHVLPGSPEIDSRHPYPRSWHPARPNVRDRDPICGGHSGEPFPDPRRLPAGIASLRSRRPMPSRNPRSMRRRAVRSTSPPENRYRSNPTAAALRPEAPLHWSTARSPNRTPLPGDFAPRPGRPYSRPPRSLSRRRMLMESRRRRWRMLPRGPTPRYPPRNRPGAGGDPRCMRSRSRRRRFGAARGVRCLPPRPCLFVRREVRRSREF